MALTFLFMLLLTIAGILIAKDRTRTLHPFNRTITDPMRGLLALLIVAHHLSTKIEIPYLSPFFRTLGMPIVAVFFLLSGYGLCVSFLKKRVAYLTGFLSKRYSKILPAFIVLTSIAVILDVCVGYTFKTQLTQFMVKGMTPLSYSWFIYAIIYTYASFYLSALVGKTPQRTGLWLIAFNFLYITLLWRFGWGTYWFATIPSVNLGYYIALYEDRIERLVVRYPLTVYALAVLMVFIGLCAESKMAQWTSTTYAIWDGFWALTLAAGAYLIIRALGTIRWKPLVWLGTISMEIYLIHGFTMKYLKYDTITRLTSGMADLTYIFLVYTLSILFAWLIHKVFSANGSVAKLQSQ